MAQLFKFLSESERDADPFSPSKEAIIAEARRAGLSTDDVAALESGETARISGAIGSETGSPIVGLQMIVQAPEEEEEEEEEPEK